MTLFTHIDNFLLGICTKIAHNFQSLTGETNFFIAKIGVFASSMGTLITIANYFGQILTRKTHFVSLVLCVIINISLFFDAKTCDQAEKTGNSGEERVLDPWLLIVLQRSENFRILWFFLSVFDTFLACFKALSPENSLVDALDQVLFSYGLTTFYYFIAVEPMRPRKSKIHEWVEKMTPATLQPVKVGSKA